VQKLKGAQVSSDGPTDSGPSKFYVQGCLGGVCIGDLI
jgi:hypothetical protein